MRIDIAYFTCGNCGHRSTPPDAINAFGNEMEVYEKIPLKKENDKLVSALDKNKKKSDVEKKFKGNKVEIKTEGSEDVVRIERSQAKVATQDATELTEAKHVVLSCPECDEILYEVTQR